MLTFLVAKILSILQITYTRLNLRRKMKDLPGDCIFEDWKVHKTGTKNLEGAFDLTEIDVQRFVLK
jgi:hypothetical protein